MKVPRLVVAVLLPPVGFVFSLMSFNWTVGLDCFGCLDVFVFMVVVVTLFAASRLVADGSDHGYGVRLSQSVWGM